MTKTRPVAPKRQSARGRTEPAHRQPKSSKSEDQAAQPRVATAPRVAQARGATTEKVRARERSTIQDGERDVEELHRKLLDAVTVPTQLDALVALGFVDFDFEKLTKRSRTTVYMWRCRKALPSAELAEIIDNTRYAAASLLSEHVPFDAASLLAWMRARSSDLGGRRPLEALAAKEFETVVTAGRRWVGADPPDTLEERDDEPQPSRRRTAR
jgi:hypothetical protein